MPRTATPGGPPPPSFRPVAGDAAAAAVARVCVGPPLNNIVEVAGPEQFRLDELIRDQLTAQNDAREVVTDPTATYFGISPSERALLPGDDAARGTIRL